MFLVLPVVLLALISWCGSAQGGILDKIIVIFLFFVLFSLFISQSKLHNNDHYWYSPRKHSDGFGADGGFGGGFGGFE